MTATDAFEAACATLFALLSIIGLVLMVQGTVRPRRSALAGIPDVWSRTQAYWYGVAAAGLGGLLAVAVGLGHLGFSLAGALLVGYPADTVRYLVDRRFGAGRHRSWGWRAAIVAACLCVGFEWAANVG